MSLATMVAGGILFIIALDEGNISAGDMVLGSDNKYVVSVPLTEEGKSNIKLKIQIQQITML